MKGFYLKFKIMLMTFAFGLAGVFTFNGSLKFTNDVYVNLPKTAIGEVIVVFPRCRFQMPFAGGGGGGRAETRLTTSRGIPVIEEHLYKEPERLTECINNQNSIHK